MNKYPILTFIGIVALIVGVIMIAVNWDQVWAWLKSLGNDNTAPTTTNGTSTNGSTTTSGGRYSTANGTGNKIICEYVNNLGQVIRMEGYGEAFANECRRKTQRDYIYRNNYAYYPYRYWYYTYPNQYYWYPWSNNYGITSSSYVTL